MLSRNSAFISLYLHILPLLNIVRVPLWRTQNSLTFLLSSTSSSSLASKTYTISPDNWQPHKTNITAKVPSRQFTLYVYRSTSHKSAARCLESHHLHRQLLFPCWQSFQSPFSFFTHKSADGLLHFKCFLTKATRWAEKKSGLK